VRPDEGEGGGWRTSGGAGLQACDGLLVLLRIARREVVREVRQGETEGIGRRGVARAHRWWRNRLATSTGRAESSKRSTSVLGTIQMRGKGRRGQRCRGTYRQPWRARGARVATRGGDRRAPMRPVLAQDSRPEEEDDLTGLAHLSASRRETIPYRFGRWE
jgi:hypothetical protein